MISALNAAEYLASAYREKYGEDITEMKLHKLLYFAQREALILDDSPLFVESFEGWRFGPVIPSIRHSFEAISHAQPITLDAFSEKVLQETLQRYGGKDPWSLSRLSHGEYSWQRSREGISEFQNSTNAIMLDDIRADARRAKERRRVLAEIEA